MSRIPSTGGINLGALCRAPSKTFSENEKMMKIVTDSCEANPDREYDHAHKLIIERHTIALLGIFVYVLCTVLYMLAACICL